jgi:hypothetical protein
MKTPGKLVVVTPWPSSIRLTSPEESDTPSGGANISSVETENALFAHPPSMSAR